MSRARHIRQSHRATCKRPDRSGRAWLFAALAVLAIAAAALGCGWPGTDHSVRFNAFRSAKEFGRLPRLSRRGDASDKLFSWSEAEDWHNEENEEEAGWTPNGIDGLWDEALEAERQGSLAAARALPIYLDVVNRYPKARAACDALYTAAVCHERLANYNNYWRAIYERGGYAGNRMVDYKDVRRAYPDYRFPLGTIGWEPATRTVNGEPGWELPPKPKPRPSRARRALARLNLLAQIALKPLANAVNSALNTVKAILQAIWKAVLWICHWLWMGYLCFWLRFVWRRSREARRLVREGLGRCPPRPVAEGFDHAAAIRDESIPRSRLARSLSQARL